MIANDLPFNNIGGYFLCDAYLMAQTDFCEAVLFHTNDFGAGKALWKFLNFGFVMQYKP